MGSSQFGGPTYCKYKVLVLIDYTSDDSEIRRARAPVRFAGLKSSLDTAFALIINNGEADALSRFFPRGVRKIFELNT